MEKPKMDRGEKGKSQWSKILGEGFDQEREHRVKPEDYFRAMWKTLQDMKAIEGGRTDASNTYTNRKKKKLVKKAKDVARSIGALLTEMDE